MLYLTIATGCDTTTGTPLEPWNGVRTLNFRMRSSCPSEMAYSFTSISLATSTCRPDGWKSMNSGLSIGRSWKDSTSQQGSYVLGLSKSQMRTLLSWKEDVRNDRDRAENAKHCTGAAWNL